MLEVVAQGGYGPTAAPLLHADGTAWFADDGAVFRISAGGEAVEEVVARPFVRGLLAHELGVAMSGSDVALWRSADGTVTELFAAEEDVAFSGLAADPNGWVVAGARQGRVVVIGPTFIAVACEVPAAPEGVAFLPGGCFIALGDGGLVRARVDRRGAIDERVEPFWDGRALGLAADADGGLWVATGTALVRLDAAGTVAAELDCPGATGVSLRGDAALVTAGDAVLRGSLGVRGAEVPIAHV